jgi:hypothetical protein
MNNSLREVTFSQLSDIEYNIYLVNSSVKDYLDIMIIQFTGHYGFGSKGNPDAVFMVAIVNAALSAWKPDALILDFTNLEYEWGDRIEELFGLTSIPLALIVGPRSEEGIRTLLLGIDSTESIDQIGWVFKDFESAKEYIESEIKKYYL